MSNIDILTASGGDILFASKYDPLKVAQVGRRLLYSDLREGAYHAPKPDEVLIIVAQDKLGKIATDEFQPVVDEITRGQSLVKAAPTIDDAIDVVAGRNILSYVGLYAVAQNRIAEVYPEPTAKGRIDEHAPQQSPLPRQLLLG